MCPWPFREDSRISSGFGFWGPVYVTRSRYAGHMETTIDLTTDTLELRLVNGESAPTTMRAGMVRPALSSRPGPGSDRTRLRRSWATA
jgi:hypothetical protein